MALYGDAGTGPVIKPGRRKRLYDSVDADTQDFQRPPQRPGVNDGPPGRPRERMDGNDSEADLPAAPEGTLRRRQQGANASIQGMLGGSLNEPGGGKPGLDDGPDKEPDADPDDLSHATPVDKEPMDGGGTKPKPHLRPMSAPGGIADRARLLRDTIRSRGPQIEDLVSRRRAQQQDRFARFGNTPTGGDPNAPKPKIRPGRRAYNPYGGGFR